jgi:uncharacterized membrane protein
MQQSTTLERAVALTLRASAYIALALAATGLLLHLLKFDFAAAVLRAAVVFLLATPVVRVAVLVVVFLRERDTKHALIALAVLAIVIGSSIVGMRLA